MAKQKGQEPYAQAGDFVRRARERKGFKQGELAKKVSMRPAQLNALEKGQNVGIEYYDRAAKGLGFRGVLELFASGGDELTRKLLRFWRALPDDEARNDVLKQLKDWIVRDEE